MSSRSVYVAELFTLGHGIPLWSPSPTETGEVRIGDVGRIKNGAFYRLCNVIYPADHPLNKLYGVPDGFEVLQYDKTLKRKRRNHVPAVLSSKTINMVDVESHASSSIAPIGGRGHIMSLKERGAALIMRDQGNLVEIDASAAFEAYAKRHAKKWFAFVRAHGLDLKTISDDNSLVLVRGYVKTTGWEMGAFDCRAQSWSAGLQASAGSALDAGLSLSKVDYTLKEPAWHSGPAIPAKRSLVGMKKYDQCVFISGVKCSRSPVFGAVALSVVP